MLVMPQCVLTCRLAPPCGSRGYRMSLLKPFRIAGVSFGGEGLCLLVLAERSTHPSSLHRLRRPSLITSSVMVPRLPGPATVRDQDFISGRRGRLQPRTGSML